MRMLARPKIFITLLLLALALAVRLPYLGTFLTIDEVKWIDGAGQFLLALRDGNLAQTYWHFFPGITVTWGEALILWLLWLAQGGGLSLADFVAARLADVAGLVGALRLSGVVITALMIPAAYWLARRRLGHAPALLGALLLTFDPFFLAHSRIINGDAIAAALMLLSVLAFLGLQPGQSWWPAALSGALGGLALLTKLPSPILIPWIGLLALMGSGRSRRYSFWLKALLAWGATALLVVVALWPALWVAPVATLQQMYADSFNVGEVGSGHEAFFLGQISDNPGWLFYPVAIAFRLTPITTIGMGLALAWLVVRRNTEAGRAGWLLAAYVLYVVLCASVSPKKLDRYVMAVFPALDVLAALGLAGAWQVITHRRPTWSTGGYAVAGVIVAGQALFAVINYPYLLSGYNLLLGGTAGAEQSIPVGWGEGLEQAASWLNRQPNARHLRVSAWYSDSFFPYFAGQRLSFSSSGKDQLAADYVVFYVNQIQRQNPYSALITYFQQQEPAFTAYANRQPWAWVYRAPQMTPLPKKTVIKGRAELLGLKLPPTAQAGTTVPVRLFMRSLGQLPPNEAWQVALVSAAATLEQPAAWSPETIVDFTARLQLPPDLPAGDYQLTVALWDTGSNQSVAQFSIPAAVGGVKVTAP